MGKRKPSAKFLAAGNAWRTHLAEYRKAHPGQSLKQQMKGASKTYKKTKTSSLRNSRYSVQIRKKTRVANKKKGKSRKKTKKRNKPLFSF